MTDYQRLVLTQGDTALGGPSEDAKYHNSRSEDKGSSGGSGMASYIINYN